MKTKTFTMRGRDGKATHLDVEYQPFMVTVDGKRLELALHHWIASWQVSDPVSGAKVCSLYGFYRGIRTGSGSLTLTEAKRRARIQVEELIAQVGVDKFNAALAKARTTAKEA